MYQPWNSCTNFGIHVPTLEYMYQLWNTCTNFGIHVPTLEYMYQFWNTCTNFGIHVPTLEFINSQICQTMSFSLKINVGLPFTEIMFVKMCLYVFQINSKSRRQILMQKKVVKRKPLSSHSNEHWRKMMSVNSN